MSNIAIQVAKRFASILDNRAYDALREVLAPHCQYEFRGHRVQGSGKIIELYRGNTEWGFKVLDQIEFESDVISESTHSARVTFTDRLHCRNEVHHYRCQQIVTVDEFDRISHIVHVDLDGEGHALDAFFKKCGVDRPRQG